MIVSEFCDSLEKSWGHRFSLFNPSPLEGFKAGVDSELKRRGYEVKWHSNNTEVTWWRAEGYISRTECYDTVFMWRQSYLHLAESPDASIYIDAAPAKLREAAAYLGDQLVQIKDLVEGNCEDKMRLIEAGCNEILS